MPTATRSTVLAAAVLGALLVPASALAAPSAGQERGASKAVKRATALLTGKMITRFTGGGATEEWSFDQRLHLCRRGRFIYDTSSQASVTRTLGRWRVTAASYRGGVARATLRGYPDGGGQVVLRLVYRGGVLHVNGALAYLERSDLC